MKTNGKCAKRRFPADPVGHSSFMEAVVNGPVAPALDGGSAAVEIPSVVPGLSDNLLITFGVVQPHERQKLRDWLEFAHGLGCDGTKLSVETVVSCMNNAVDIYHQFRRRTELLQGEIARMQDEMGQRERDFIARGQSGDDALVALTREHELMVLNLEERFRAEAETADERHRASENRVETDLFNLTEELSRVQREHGVAMETVTAELKGLARSLEEQVAANAALVAENEGLRNAARVRTLTADGGVFFDRVSMAEAACPVFLGTGCVISMRTLVGMWVDGPGQFDGEIHRSVICPKTHEQTFVAAKEQLEFVRSVGVALGLDVAVPMRFEYTSPPDGSWTEFAFVDQIALASKTAKIYRRRAVGPGDFVLVGQGVMKVVFSVDSGDSHARLSMYVQSLTGDATMVMQGRVVLAAGWNPFPNMDLA